MERIRGSWTPVHNALRIVYLNVWWREVFKPYASQPPGSVVCDYIAMRFARSKKSKQAFIKLNGDPTNYSYYLYRLEFSRLFGMNFVWILRWTKHKSNDVTCLNVIRVLLLGCHVTSWPFDLQSLHSALNKYHAFIIRAKRTFHACAISSNLSNPHNLRTTDNKPRSRTELDGTISCPPSDNGSVGSCDIRRDEVHHSKFVLPSFSWSRLLHIHDATSTTQSVIRRVSSFTLSGW